MTGPRQLFGYCTGAEDKHSTARFNRSLAAPLAIPVQKNGALLTGKQPDGRILVVIDFDVEAGKPALPLDVLDHASLQTFVVRTPRGGLHVYFYLTRKSRAPRASRHGMVAWIKSTAAGRAASCSPPVVPSRIMALSLTRSRSTSPSPAFRWKRFGTCGIATARRGTRNGQRIRPSGQRCLDRAREHLPL
ncbi:MAG: hypothetical protein GYA24_24535 [Candidatus Lokiarchaeota archaeon]|nr:hypothetical protein [Candidatus Lokiarchaeota archaeon]